jgi:hypothetical protein
MQALPTGGHELRRVRFAKQMFSSDDAEQWWAANRSAVYANYNIVGLPHQQQQQQPGLVALSGQTQQQRQSSLGGGAPLLSSAGGADVTSNGGSGSADEQQQQGVVGGRVSAAAVSSSSAGGGGVLPAVVSVMNPHPLGPPVAVTSRAGSLSEVRTKR